MKKAASALQAAEVPYLLGGGLACWARGGPRTEHDVDFFVRPEHAEAALESLARSGMAIERPPEQWLLKAFDGDVLIDLIFEPSGRTVDDAMFLRAEVRDVDSMRLPVASLEDVLATKLLSLSEQSLDYTSVLEITRALREQIDWADVRDATAHSPYARAFFTLVEGLEIVPAGDVGDAPPNGPVGLDAPAAQPKRPA